MKIEKINRLNGEVVKTFNSIKKAAKEAKVSELTVKRQLNGENYNTRCGWTWRYVETDKEKKSKKNKRVLKIDINGNILKKYNSVKEASEDTGDSRGHISNLLSGRNNMNSFISRIGYGYKWDDGEETTQELIKPTTEMYFINVMVGLVNRDLVDGAIYTIGTFDYKYDKSQDALLDVVDGHKVYTRDMHCAMVKVTLPLLTEEERAFMKTMLKAFKGIKSIRKCKHYYNGLEFIRLESISKINNIDLDTFKEGQYYNGLELDRSYTLEELELNS